MEQEQQRPTKWWSSSAKSSQMRFGIETRERGRMRGYASEASMYARAEERITNEHDRIAQCPFHDLLRNANDEGFKRKRQKLRRERERVWMQ